MKAIWISGLLMACLAHPMRDGRAEPTYDYPAEMMSDCRRDLRAVTVTAMDIAVVIQGCSEALAHPVTEVRPFPDNRARVLTSRAGPIH